MTQQPLARLLFLLETVETEGRHLLGTASRLADQRVDAAWVKRLEEDFTLAERVDAFAARFGCMQDTLGDRVVPELLRQLLETPGSAIDNLNRLEKLGLLESVEQWVEARNLRNRLFHEYMRDADEFAQALVRARQLVSLLVRTYNAVNRHAATRWASGSESWPSLLDE